MRIVMFEVAFIDIVVVLCVSFRLLVCFLLVVVFLVCFCLFCLFLLWQSGPEYCRVAICVWCLYV